MLRIDRTLQTLKSAIKQVICPIEQVWMCHGDYKYETFEASSDKTMVDLPWRVDAIDERFFFAFEMSLPLFEEDKTYAIEISTGREGMWDAVNPQLLAYIDGNIICGLDTNHREMPLDSALSGKRIKTGCHLYTGMQAGDISIRLQLISKRSEVHKAYYDLKVLYDSLLAMPIENQGREALLYRVRAVVESIRFSPSERDFMMGCRELSRKLREECYLGLEGGDGPHESQMPYTVHALGHTHIDVAWLWDLRQTKEKVARSYSTALNLQERYKSYKFMASQPILYEMLCEAQPQVFNRIKDATMKGLWESEGAMYLEADCNLASGESLVRQIEMGQMYLKGECGKKARTLWLPDVFGYSAALPQILSSFGIELFITSKISWNDTNKMPFDSFLWQGIDGSRIPTQFITTVSMETLSKGEFKTIYEGNFTPTEVLGTVSRHQQREKMPHMIMPYGFGDGGGGANEEMLETAIRLSLGIMGMPFVRMSSLSEYVDFYKNVKEDALPIWSGELYLEYHRGTYTTNGGIKKRHRHLEDQLLQFEKALATRRFFNLIPSSISMEALNQHWKILLLNQFHDILPGTSIERVYQEAYEQLEEASGKLADEMKSVLNIMPTQEKESFVIFNGHYRPFEGPLWIELPEDFSKDLEYEVRIDEERFSLQHGFENRWVLIIPKCKGLKPLSSKTIQIVKTGRAFKEQVQKGLSIESAYYRATFNTSGDIVSLYDKVADRRVLYGHRLCAYEDRPLKWDAWDINEDYKKYPLSFDASNADTFQIESSGPLASVVKVLKKLGNSTIQQRFVFYNGDMDLMHSAGRIDCFVNVDWHEHQVLLRAELDTDIHATHATYDIQFGQVNRPIDENHSFNSAMFEVCAQHWGSLSEGDYGIMLMSNDKFGYNALGKTLGLSLIKSPTWPNPNSDQGQQSFSYAFLPTRGEKIWDSEKHEMALLFCQAPKVFRGSNRDELSSLPFEVPKHFSLESMRVLESGELEIRLVERGNRRGVCQLISSDERLDFNKFKIRKWCLNGDLLEVCEKGVFSFKPFEIISLTLLPL